jgi:large subunit ribosomal protein L32
MLLPWRGAAVGGPPLLFLKETFPGRDRSMANPKRRHSHSRTRMRRAHDHLRRPFLGACPKCGQPTLRHQICGYCGYYRGLEVIKMEAEEEAAATTP